MTRHRIVLQALAALAVVASAIVLVWSAVSTSSARVAATTSGTSFFTAGVVELSQPDSAVDLLFDADGLYPGVEVSGCVEIDYHGSIPSSVRLHASRTGGTGLEAFIDVEVAIVAGDTCSTSTAATRTPIFSGRLSQFWGEHPTYDRAIVLEPAMASGGRVVIEALASVADDNRAQGLSSDFALTVEARP